MKDNKNDVTTTSRETLNNPQKSNHISREERVVNHLTTHGQPQQREQQSACCSTTKSKNSNKSCC